MEVDSNGKARSQKSKCNRKVQRTEERQKSRPKDREVLFIYFLEAILWPGLNI